MCIRDRLAERAHLIYLGAYSEKLQLPGLGAYAAAKAGLEAVSYTHLRAHETVLDLVCRLLLEKKKQKHIIQHLHNTAIHYSHKSNHHSGSI